MKSSEFVEISQVAPKSSQIATAASDTKSTLGSDPPVYLWINFAKKLPTANTVEARAKRIALFNELGINGSNTLTLEEIGRGLVRLLKCEGICNLGPVLHHALKAATNKGMVLFIVLT